MKRVRKNQNILFFILFFCLMAPVIAAGKKIPIPKPVKTEKLVSQILIRQAGWTYNWQLNLPIKTNEVIDRLYVFDEYLYVLTDTNILFCIDRQKGRTLFSHRLCTEGLPICDPIYYDGRLGFMIGNQMKILDPASGLIQQTEVIEQVGDTFECGVARNDDYIYMTGSDLRLHAISTDGFWQAFTATADNDSPINSVVATDSVVVFSTQAGNIVGIEPNAAKKRWQYDASGRIRAKIVLDGKFVYAVGLDAKLYKINIDTGVLAWNLPYHAGAPVLDPAVIGKNVVYVYNDLNGLYAVSKNEGQAVWNIPTGQRVLCESENKAFVYTKPGVLKVMDNKTGKELYSVNFSEVRRYAENMTDATLYVADTDGRLMGITTR